MAQLNKIFPILEWLPNYKKESFNKDLLSGLTVGVMLIPQGMAYALIAGLPPVYGLYAAIVPQIIYALLGTSRQLAVGPVAMDSLLVASGVSLLATEGTDTYITFAILLATIMGFFQLMLGVFRMGFITNLLSKPVISGFTSAAAIIIGLNQIKHLLGIEVVRSNQFFEIIISTGKQLSSIHWLTLTIGIAGIVIIQILKKLNKNIPGSLIAVAIGTATIYFLNWHHAGVNIVGDIPKGLPQFSLPDFDWTTIKDLIPLALTISIIAYMEAFSIAKAIESKKRNYKVRPNQELIALGAANIFGSLFQSYPVTGGFSRSAVNDETGAVTPVSSMISALFVALILIFLTPVFYYLPKAILASVIMVAVYGLIDYKYTKQLWKDSKIEFALLLATFLLTLNFSIVPGIVGGIVLSILYLLFKSAYPHIAQLGRVKGHHEFRNIHRFKDLDIWEHLMILRVDAPLTFINIQYFREYIENSISESNHTIEAIILDAGPISHLDATASQGIKDLLIYLEEQNIELLICDVIGPVRDIMQKTGLNDLIKKEHIFLDLNEAVRYATTHNEGRFKDYALQSNVSD